MLLTLGLVVLAAAVIWLVVKSSHEASNAEEKPVDETPVSSGLPTLASIKERVDVVSSKTDNSVVSLVVEEKSTKKKTTSKKKIATEKKSSKKNTTK